jgi:hypothetical protein
MGVGHKASYLTPKKIIAMKSQVGIARWTCNDDHCNARGKGIYEGDECEELERTGAE